MVPPSAFTAFQELEMPSNLIDMRKEDLIKTAKIINAVSSKIRLKILKFINERGQATVTDIVENLNIKQSAASQHVGILLDSDILEFSRSGHYKFYGLNKLRLKQVLQASDMLLKQQEIAESHLIADRA